MMLTPLNIQEWWRVIVIVGMGAVCLPAMYEIYRQHGWGYATFAYAYVVLLTWIAMK